MSAGAEESQLLLSPREIRNAVCLATHTPPPIRLIMAQIREPLQLALLQTNRQLRHEAGLEFARVTPIIIDYYDFMQPLLGFSVVLPPEEADAAPMQLFSQFGIPGDPVPDAQYPHSLHLIFQDRDQSLLHALRPLTINQYVRHELTRQLRRVPGVVEITVRDLMFDHRDQADPDAAWITDRVLAQLLRYLPLLRRLRVEDRTGRLQEYRLRGDRLVLVL